MLSTDNVTGIDLIAPDSWEHPIGRIFNADDITVNLLDGVGTDLDMGFIAAEEIVPTPSFTVMFTDGVFPARGQQGGWPRHISLENILIVIVPAGNSAKPPPKLLTQAEEAARHYGNATVVGVDLSEDM